MLYLDGLIEDRIHLLDKTTGYTAEAIGTETSQTFQTYSEILQNLFSVHNTIHRIFKKQLNFLP